MSRFIIAIALLGALYLSTSAAQPQRQITVAAAADLKFALDQIIADFARTHPDVRVTVSYGSSGNFFAQLSNRAPYDVYFSADVDYPQKLVEAGVADADSLFVYAIGRIVVWTRSASGIDVPRDQIRALLDPRVRKIAIANPRHAPYGQAAVSAMQALGIYDDVRPRLVFGENVAQAAQFVESGAADIGIIALALALAPQLQQQGVYWEIPLENFPRMEQGAVILKHAKNPVAARHFLDYVRSDDGRSTLRRFGFYLPGDEIPATQPAGARPAEN